MSQAIPVSHVGDSSPTPDSKPPFTDENLAPEFLKSVVAQDVSITLKNARSISPANETSGPIQNFASPFFPQNLTRTTHLFGDTDELSEISEFEPNNTTAKERAVTRVSAFYNHGSKTTRHRIDRMRMNEVSTATSSNEIKISSVASKTANQMGGVAQRSPETGKQLSSPDSAMFGSSSSTQIDLSSRLLSNTDTLLTTIGTENVDGLSIASHHLVGVDMLRKMGVNECGPSDKELVITSAGKQIGLRSARGERGQHIRHITPSSNAHQEPHFRIEITKDTSIPPKIAGSRRKRESIKSSSKPAIDIDDEYTPPRKKSRNNRLELAEDKVKSNETLLDVVPIFRAKICSKTAKHPPPGVDPTAAGLDEFVELKSTCQGTRRSSRIKKRQIAATDGTRHNDTRGKARKGKQGDGHPGCDVERRNLAADSLQDTGVEIGHGTPSVLSSRPIVIRGSPSPKLNSQVVSDALSQSRILSNCIFATLQSLVELSSAKNITPEASLPRQTTKVSFFLAPLWRHSVICRVAASSLVYRANPVSHRVESQWKISASLKRFQMCNL